MKLRILRDETTIQAGSPEQKPGDQRLERRREDRTGVTDQGRLAADAGGKGSTLRNGTAVGPGRGSQPKPHVTLY
jgi:hypothetical protein